MILGKDKKRIENLTNFCLQAMVMAEVNKHESLQQGMDARADSARCVLGIIRGEHDSLHHGDVEGQLDSIYRNRLGRAVPVDEPSNP